MTSRCGTRSARTVGAAASSTVAAALTLALALAPVARGQGAAGQNIELPPFSGALRDDYYPEAARLHFRQGRALVEFSLDARGIPTNVVLVNADPAREFDDAARLLARNLRYQLPPGWPQGNAAHRFRLGVRFQVVECINFSTCEPNARNPPADYDSADRTYVLSAPKRVLALLNPSAATPPAAPPATRTAAPTPGTPTLTPSAASPSAPPQEPVYPPG